MWPDHCVVGTKGAEIDKTLRASFGPWRDKMWIVRKVSAWRVHAKAPVSCSPQQL